MPPCKCKTLSLNTNSNNYEQFTPTKTCCSQLQIENNVAVCIYLDASSIILKHYIRSHGVLNSSRHLGSRMEQSSVLENEDTPNFWINVESALPVG
jgi:hypothetical protein